MKKTIIVLTLIFALCLTVALPAMAADLDVMWVTYFNFLQKKKTEGGCGYADVIDFDADGVPELLYFDRGERTKYTDGTVRIDEHVYYWNGSTMKELGGFVNELYKTGSTSYSINKATDGKTYCYTYYNGRVDIPNKTITHQWTLRSKVGTEFTDAGTFLRTYHYSWVVSKDSHSDKISEDFVYIDDINDKTTKLTSQKWFDKLDSYINESRQKKLVFADVNEPDFNLDPLIKTVGSKIKDQGYVTHYLAPSVWAKENVDKAIKNGYVPQSLQMKYDRPITRAEFCALAVKYYEAVSGKTITARENYTDTESEAVRKMGGLGVINGYGNGKFGPDDPLTREQAAVILANLAEKAFSSPLQAGELNFTDNGSISDWAKDKVASVQAAGIMNGVGDGKFDPKGNYTREQSIVTLVRMSFTPSN